MKFILKATIIISLFSLSVSGQMSQVPVQQQPRVAQPPPGQTPKPALTPAPIVAATPKLIPKPAPKVEDNTLWYISLTLLVGALVGAILWFVKGKRNEKVKAEKLATSINKTLFEEEAVDGDRELEWLRKNQELIDKRRKKTSRKRAFDTNNLPDSSILEKKRAAKNVEEILINDDEKGVKIANRSDLPIFAISSIEEPSRLNLLPNSNDESVLGGIEQVSDEFEEDENVRELAVRVLAMFRFQNSIEALTEVALYDLSAPLRVKSLIVLSEFDHESVFETVLLACADPTREVKAAAARALTRLTFDRAEAWSRVAKGTDVWRLKQAADATIESGFVERSFDRLIQNDFKQVYEAVSLLNILVKADKIDLILEKLDSTESIDLKIAILRVLQITNAKNSLPHLYKIYSEKGLQHDFGDALDFTIHHLGMVETV
jgi:hypothetical protein